MDNTYIFGYQVKSIIQYGTESPSCSKILSVEDNKTKISYIMKMLTLNSRGNLQWLELDLVSRLRHPNIMSLSRLIIPTGLCDNREKKSDSPTTKVAKTQYIALLFEPGIPLIKYLKINKVDSTTKIRMMYNLLQGVKFLHEHHIVHFDLKHSNIVVTDGSSINPIPRIIDFGSADLTDSDTTIDRNIYENYYYTRFESDAKTHGSASDIQMLGLIFIDIILETELAFIKYFGNVSDGPSRVEKLHIDSTRRHVIKDLITSSNDVNDEFLDLLLLMINPKYKLRKSATELLNHRYFRIVSKITVTDDDKIGMIVPKDTPKSSVTSSSNDLEILKGLSTKLKLQGRVLDLAIDLYRRSSNLKTSTNSISFLLACLLIAVKVYRMYECLSDMLDDINSLIKNDIDKSSNSLSLIFRSIKDVRSISNDILNDEIQILHRLKGVICSETIKDSMNIVK